MMRLKIKRILLAIAVIAMWAVAHPACAQNSGIGGDNFTRLLWQGTDGSAAVYKLDISLNLVNSHTYGPFDQWLPVALTVAANSYT
jgi:hypothetical protein